MDGYSGDNRQNQPNPTHGSGQSQNQSQYRGQNQNQGQGQNNDRNRRRRQRSHRPTQGANNYHGNGQQSGGRQRLSSRGYFIPGNNWSRARNNQNSGQQKPSMMTDFLSKLFSSQTQGGGRNPAANNKGGQKANNPLDSKTIIFVVGIAVVALVLFVASRLGCSPSCQLGLDIAGNVSSTDSGTDIVEDLYDGLEKPDTGPYTDYVAFLEINAYKYDEVPGDAAYQWSGVGFVPTQFKTSMYCINDNPEGMTIKYYVKFDMAAPKGWYEVQPKLVMPGVSAAWYNDIKYTVLDIRIDGESVMDKIRGGLAYRPVCRYEESSEYPKRVVYTIPVGYDFYRENESLLSEDMLNGCKTVEFDIRIDGYDYAMKE